MCEYPLKLPRWRLVPQMERYLFGKDQGKISRKETKRILIDEMGLKLVQNYQDDWWNGTEVNNHRFDAEPLAKGVEHWKAQMVSLIATEGKPIDADQFLRTGGLISLGRTVRLGVDFGLQLRHELGLGLNFGVVFVYNGRMSSSGRGQHRGGKRENVLSLEDEEFGVEAAHWPTEELRGGFLECQGELVSSSNFKNYHL